MLKHGIIILLNIGLENIMLSKNSLKEQNQYQVVALEDLVPKNHLVRDISNAIDFNFIYDEVKDLYNQEIGRPSIDPVVLFKMILIQYMFGIRSMRQTVKEIEVNLAYRWFLGFDFFDNVPHFSTFGKNYERRFKDTDIFEKIFMRILDEAINCGFVDSSSVFIDSTCIKASANKKKRYKEIVENESKKYINSLDKEIKEDRNNHNKKPLKDKDDDDDQNKTITKSTTDPESGILRKGEHEKIFAYSAHTACDKHNFVLSACVTPANVHDSMVFDEIYDKVNTKFPNTQNFVLDAAYKTPWICKRIIDDNKIPFLPYKRPMTKKGFYKKYEYVYDKYYDHYVCPNGEILKYTTTNRLGYKEYKSNSKTCENCQQREQCTNNKKFNKLVTRHVWSEYLEIAEEIRHTELWKDIYPQRSKTVERLFGDAKEKHGMRYTQLRGLKKVKIQVYLTFTCMNLKKLAKWKKIKELSYSFLQNFSVLFTNSLILLYA